MAFKRYYLWGDWEWCGLDQFRRVIDDLLHSSVNTTGVGWLNSPRVELAQFFRLRRGNDFLSVCRCPCCFRIFCPKKMPLDNMFRVIFFLPNVIPIVALTLAFKLPFDSTYGYMYTVMSRLGMRADVFASWPSSRT